MTAHLCLPLAGHVVPLAGHVVPLAGHGSVDWASFGVWEWIALGGSALFVAWSIWRAIDLTVHPGEEGPTHIKRMILQDPKSLDVSVRWKDGPVGQPLERGTP